MNGLLVIVLTAIFIDTVIECVIREVDTLKDLIKDRLAKFEMNYINNGTKIVSLPILVKSREWLKKFRKNNMNLSSDKNSSC